MLGDLEALDSIKPVMLRYEFDITIDSELGREKPKLAQINIFTDGSKQTAGYVIMKGRCTLIHADSIALQREATIFQPEAAAIHQAVTFVLENYTEDIRFIRIFSDSQAVLLAIRNKFTTSEAVLDTKVHLNKLKAKANTIHVLWIKAHAVFNGNELADEYVCKNWSLE